MSFPEKIKKEVMKKAGYHCCVCHRSAVSVEVHHIIPQAEGGDDSIENAAPLCPSCHSDYGGNPEKRTRIKQMRDWWYETTAQMYASKITSPEHLNGIHKSLQKLNIKQNSILKKQDKHDSDLEDLRVHLKAISNNMIDSMTPATSDITTSSIVSAAVSSIRPTKDNEVTCNRCGSLIDVRNDFCPRCNQYMG